MRRTARNVQKSDNYFLDMLKEKFRGRKLRITLEKTRYAFKGFGVKEVSRDQEKITAEVLEDTDNEGK